MVEDPHKHIKVCTRKIPRDAVVANSCKVPLGCIVSPFLVELEDRVTKVSLGEECHGLRCNACGAFINKYCQAETTTGTATGTNTNKNPNQNLHSNAWTWKCVLCGKINGIDRSKVPEEAVRAQTRLSSEAVEFRSVNENTLEEPKSKGKKKKVKRTLLLVLDATLDEDHFAKLSEGLVNFFSDSELMDPETQVGLVTFTSVVSLYRLHLEEKGKGMVSADIFPANSALWGKIGRKTNQPGLGRHRSHGRGVSAAASGSLSEDPFLHSFEGEEDTRERGGGHLGEYIMQVGDEHFIPNLRHILRSVNCGYTSHLAQHERPRCMVSAIELCKHLVKRCSGDVDHDDSFSMLTRVMVCTGGQCTAGPGALPPEDHPEFLHLERETNQYMEELAQDLTGHRIIIDIFGAGHCPLDVPVLYPLTQNTGGSLLIYERFENEYFRCLKAAYKRFIGVSAVVDFRLSHTLGIEQIIGPIKAISPAMRRGTGNHQQMWSSNAVEMTSVETGQGITVSLQAKRDIPEAVTYLQVDIRYLSLDGAVHHRVITTTVSVTGSGREFILSVDPLVAGVVLAKRSLVHVRKAGYTPKAISRLKKELGNLVYEMSRNFSPKIRSQYLFSKSTCVVKEELAVLAEFVYHLCRSTVMSANVHVDEKMIFVAQLLSSDVTKSILMIWPRCLSLTSVRSVDLPCADLILQTCEDFLMDCGTNCFIYRTGMEKGTRASTTSASASASVRENENEEEEEEEEEEEKNKERCFHKYQEYIHHMPLTRSRFPSPQIHLCQRGTPNVRYVASRLIPLRQDSDDQQERQMPSLGDMDASKRKDHFAQLISSLHCTDEPSFQEWCKGIHLRVDQRLATPWHGSSC